MNDLILADPNEDHGPHFAGLTQKQQNFVHAMLVLGGGNTAEAARAAGYETGHKQEGYRQMRNPAVIAALQEEAQRRLASHAVLASSALVALVRDQNHKDHFKATIELLNRSGLQFIQKHEHTIRDERTVGEILEAVRSLAERNGLAVGKGEVLDAQYTDVSGDPALLDILGDADGE